MRPKGPMPQGSEVNLRPRSEKVDVEDGGGEVDGDQEVCDVGLPLCGLSAKHGTEAQGPTTV